MPTLPQLRLLAYGLVAIAFIILGSICNHYREQRADLRKSVATMEEANAVSQKAIQELHNQREVDGKYMEQLLKENEKIRLSDRRVRARLKELERKNEDVRNFLDVPIPVELKRVLLEEDGGTDGTSSSQPTGNVDGEVPPPAGSIPNNSRGSDRVIPRVANRRSRV